MGGFAFSGHGIDPLVTPVRRRQTPPTPPIFFLQNHTYSHGYLAGGGIGSQTMRVIFRAADEGSIEISHSNGVTAQGAEITIDGVLCVQQDSPVAAPYTVLDLPLNTTVIDNPATGSRFGIRYNEEYIPDNVAGGGAGSVPINTYQWRVTHVSGQAPTTVTPPAVDTWTFMTNASEIQRAWDDTVDDGGGNREFTSQILVEIRRFADLVVLASATFDFERYIYTP